MLSSLTKYRMAFVVGILVGVTAAVAGGVVSIIARIKEKVGPSKDRNQRRGQVFEMVPDSPKEGGIGGYMEGPFAKTYTRTPLFRKKKHDEEMKQKKRDEEMKQKKHDEEMALMSPFLNMQGKLRGNQPYAAQVTVDEYTLTHVNGGRFTVNAERCHGRFTNQAMDQYSMFCQDDVLSDPWRASNEMWATTKNLRASPL